MSTKQEIQEYYGFWACCCYNDIGGIRQYNVSEFPELTKFKGLKKAVEYKNFLLADYIIGIGVDVNLTIRSNDMGEFSSREKNWNFVHHAGHLNSIGIRKNDVEILEYTLAKGCNLIPFWSNPIWGNLKIEYRDEHVEELTSMILESDNFSNYQKKRYINDLLSIITFSPKERDLDLIKFIKDNYFHFNPNWKRSFRNMNIRNSIQLVENIDSIIQNR